MKSHGTVGLGEKIMTIEILYFASLSDLMERDSETLELAEGSTAAQMLDVLEEQSPVLRDFDRRFRVAVNQTFVELDSVIPDGAEVAFIPPVSGGEPPSVKVSISKAELDIQAATQAVRRNDCGAVVTFLGTVRDLTGDQVTDKLDYTAYEKMAESELRAICEEAIQRWELGGIVVEHRIGSLHPGEVAVVVACSSAHRDGAFEAARFLIDTTKERVPLWKKEFSPDGTAWIEGDARVQARN